MKIDEFVHHNGVAFVESFLWEGRRYNVSTDLRVLPADRFRPIRGSDFHGWVIGEDIDFPFALVRKKGAKKYRFDGKKMVSAGDLEWRTAVKLTGKQKMEGSHLYYEAADGTYVDDRSAGRVDPAKKMPGLGEERREVDRRQHHQAGAGGVRGDRSRSTPRWCRAGRRGSAIPRPPRAPSGASSASTPSTCPSPWTRTCVGEEFELRDVPYVQYFENGYALHGAYWHDVFGQPKSHGCVNLAPEDARRLFFWTEPQIPPGWQGVARSLTGTVVFVHP